jgi:hypothetical protein
MKIGEQNSIILHDLADMKEIFAKDEAAARPDLMLFQVLLYYENVGK